EILLHARARHAHEAGAVERILGVEGQQRAADDIAALGDAHRAAAQRGPALAEMRVGRAAAIEISGNRLAEAMIDTSLVIGVDSTEALAHLGARMHIGRWRPMVAELVEGLVPGLHRAAR